MKENPTVLLIGYGYVAQATARRLTRQGWRVLATTRQADSLAAIRADQVEPILSDPAKEEGARALREAVGGARYVLSSVPPGPLADPVLPVLDGLDLSRHWVGYLSTTGVYGDHKGGWAFEGDPVTPGQPRSVRRAEAEAGWSRHGARLFRIAGIYGPGRSAFDRLRDGSATRIDKPGHVFSRVHVEDIATAITAAMQNPERSGPFNLADDSPCPQAEVVEGAAALLGISPPPLVPVDEATLSPMMESFYAENRRVSNARAKAQLGWRLQYPSWREGMAAILEAETQGAA